ncbi:SDR family oxidoreductase [Actinomadura barringtoniae]|uniref:SDR family oxidoreductase n=2 Tax=Actinomadura barringtoniae TaxID=1427535 RepID=A0A939TCW2_9ACTN|nr:SDR family oxidoreductase [Actinomadura barringtoniae]
MGGTSGIGLAAAERLAAEGADVVVTGRRPATVKVPSEIVDGTDEAQVKEFFDGLGEFDHLVLAFSPGPAGMGPVKDTPSEGVRTAFGKVFGYLVAIRHARVTGSITMISAATARAALPGTAALAGANGALERMASPLAAELSPVRVNVVSPGVVDTPWWSFLPEDQRQAQFTGTAETLPVKRVGQAEDVAEAISYLVNASYVTGTILPVDGGFTVA